MSNDRGNLTRAAGPKVVGLGGGHGLAATLAAARTYAGDITAVVSIADDGGSSGRLRRELDIAPPGDVRRCLVALADEPTGPLGTAFGYRFHDGDLAGHAVGNLLLAGLAASTGSFDAAIAEASRLLGTHGDVLTATVGPIALAGRIGGARAAGQAQLTHLGGAIERIWVEPADPPVPAAVLRAIADADQVILGPGSLFTSILAVAVVPAIQRALAERTAGIVFVCNLKPSKETIGFDAAAHVDALAAHGVIPHTVLLDPAAIEPGDLRDRAGGPRVATAALARRNGWSHDVGRLGAALAECASEGP